MRRPVVLPCTLCVLLATAGCSSSSKSGSPATRTSASTTSSGPPTSVVVPGTTAIATTVTQFVYVLSVDLGAHTITVDPIQFLTGPAAVTAFRHANPGAKEGPPNDYFIVNAKRDRLVMPLESNATVRVVEVGGQAHTQPVQVPQSALVHYSGLGSRPFLITSRRGRVIAVTERFVP